MNRDVLLRVDTPLPERLIDRALQAGARFACVRRSGNSLLVSADPAGAALLAGLCRQYAIPCRILRRSGCTALRELLRRRWTLLPGILLGALLCALFFSRIWFVDVSFVAGSADAGAETQIRAVLADLGVHAGMAARKADTTLLRDQLAAHTGGLSFVGVRRQGVRLLVEAACEQPAPPVYEIDYARDLVAARDGIVRSVAVQAGTAAVRPGDTVRAGQLLIRGEEPAGGDEMRPVNALGRVRASCWVEGCASAGTRTELLKPTGRTRSSSRLRLFGMELRLTDCASYPAETIETRALPLVGLFLPLYLERSVHSELVSVQAAADEARLAAHLEELARADALTKAERGCMDYSIASEWTDAENNGNSLRVRAVFEICTDIAVTRDVLTEEVY